MISALYCLRDEPGGKFDSPPEPRLFPATRTSVVFSFLSPATPPPPPSAPLPTHFIPFQNYQPPVVNDEINRIYYSFQEKRQQRQKICQSSDRWDISLTGTGAVAGSIPEWQKTLTGSQLVSGCIATDSLDYERLNSSMNHLVRY